MKNTELAIRKALEKVMTFRILKDSNPAQVILKLLISVCFDRGACKCAFTRFTVFCYPALFAGVSFRMLQFFVGMLHKRVVHEGARQLAPIDQYATVSC